MAEAADRLDAGLNNDLSDNLSERSAQYPAAAQLVSVQKVSADGLLAGEDQVATEEPLEIRLAWPTDQQAAVATAGEHYQVAVTMRTPGNDRELALGFLFTEGVLHSYDQVAGVASLAEHPERGENSAERNIIVVELKQPPEIDLTRLERNFYVSSSCGVCGKASIEAIRTHARFPVRGGAWQLSSEMLLRLPRQMKKQQQIFQDTGSIHAAALFTDNGLDAAVYEDVGRHNAVDKLIGSALLAGRLPLWNSGILVSGRASFELVQKARMAGCAMLAAVGAPSSLAIELAWESDMTLIGFLRDGRFNVYTGPAGVAYP